MLLLCWATFCKEILRPTVRAVQQKEVMGKGACAHLEDETLLAAVWQRKLNLAVEAARPQQRGIQRVSSVSRHDHLSAPHHLVSQRSSQLLSFSCMLRTTDEGSSWWRQGGEEEQRGEWGCRLEDVGSPSKVRYN